MIVSPLTPLCIVSQKDDTKDSSRGTNPLIALAQLPCLSWFEKDEPRPMYLPLFSASVMDVPLVPVMPAVVIAVGMVIV